MAEHSVLSDLVDRNGWENLNLSCKSLLPSMARAASDPLASDLPRSLQRTIPRACPV